MERQLDYVQLKNQDGYYVKPNAISTRPQQPVQSGMPEMVFIRF